MLLQGKNAERIQNFFGVHHVIAYMTAFHTDSMPLISLPWFNHQCISTKCPPLAPSIVQSAAESS
jgi:hypothetical protein